MEYTTAGPGPEDREFVAPDGADTITPGSDLDIEDWTKGLGEGRGYVDISDDDAGQSESPADQGGNHTPPEEEWFTR